jgi:hypothetical protein
MATGNQFKTRSSFIIPAKSGSTLTDDLPDPGFHCANAQQDENILHRRGILN